MFRRNSEQIRVSLGFEKWSSNCRGPLLANNHWINNLSLTFSSVLETKRKRTGVSNRPLLSK